MARGRRPYNNPTEDKMIDTLEELDVFREEFMQLTPEIREALKNGTKPADILKKGSAAAAARLLNLALTSTDEAKALTAIRDILDRTEGKAKEIRQVEHRLAEMKDEDLNNLLEQEMLTLNAMDSDEDA